MSPVPRNLYLVPEREGVRFLSIFNGAAYHTQITTFVIDVVVRI